MKSSNTTKNIFPVLKRILLYALLIFFTFSLTSCKRDIDYFTYVSELRSNILLARVEKFSLRIYAAKKEQPYAADGIPRETVSRTEFYLTAPTGEHTCNLSFTYGNVEYTAEMSYDNVKGEYYYYCPLNLTEATVVICRIEYGDDVFTLEAKTVKTPDVLSPKTILSHIQKSETELFNSMTDKYGFTGEIRLRLIYEDAPYYYVGIIDRNGNATAFLLNAETGKILAKRQT
jgi:hypothetical protein